ncbi:MAG: hypothetical protein M5R36_02100 [Deltaproteobacteria bacterium]|nr:hypothetical protein [Deltaproteobacteria bacterium]
MTDRLGHVREMFAAEFHATDDSDAFYMEQRNHRCTIADTFWKHGFFLRYPIADNALQELVVGLGTEIRQSSALYRDMVLAAFPDFFQSIPWQKTGVPVGAPTWLAQLSRKSRYQAGRVVGLVNRWGLPVQSLRNYQNYAAWIREQPARRLVEGLLLDPKARYAHYTPPALVTRLVEEHMGRRKSHTDEIGMALTFEVMARWMDGTLDDDMARLAHD